MEVLVWVLTLEFWPRRAGGQRRGDFLIKDKEVTDIKTKRRHRHMTKTRQKRDDKDKDKSCDHLLKGAILKRNTKERSKGSVHCLGVAK